MKRLQRAVIAILCIVCLAFGMIACGDDDDGAEATYTVTVTGDVSPLELTIATVKLQNENGEDATEAKHLTLNDKGSEGTVTFKLAKGKYTVVIDGDFGDRFPQGNMQLTASVRSTTIAIDKEPIVPVLKEYRVRFVLPDNTPVPNLDVQICSNQCHYATTDENGWASWNLAADTYEVHVPEENWPNGYYFDDSAYTLTATRLELTAKFKAYKQYSVSVKYATYASGQWTLTTPAANIELKISRYDDYAGGVTDEELATATTNADGVATFSAPTTNLWVDITGGINAGYVQDGLSTHIDGEDYDDSLVIGLYPVGSSAMACAELKLNTATQVSALASGNIWYEFNPTQSGEYTLTSTGDVDASCTMPSSINFGGDVSVSNEKNGNNFTLVFNVGASEIGNVRFIFNIVAGAGTFTVNLTRSGDYEEPQVLVGVNVPAEHVDATADMLEVPSESKFTSLATDLILKKDAAGYYHLDNATTGPLIYASIGGKYAPSGISGGFQGIIESPTGLQSITITDGETFKYVYTDFVKEYIKVLNADGLYPLNDELKLFLERYHRYQLGGTADYTFACGYYTSLYSQLIGSSVGIGDYRFTVDAGDTKALSYTPKFYTDTKQVAVTVTSGNVKLLDSEGDVSTKLILSPNESFSVKNEGDSAATVVLHVEYNTAGNQITDLGEYLVKASEWGTQYEFIAPEANTYTFAVEEGDVDVVDQNDNTTSGEPVTLAAGQKVTLVVYTPMGVSEDTITTLTIAIYTPATPLNVGPNTVTGTAEGTIYTFTATESGEYTITIGSDGYVVLSTYDVLDGSSSESNSVTLTLEANETITFECSPSDWDADSATFTITITKA